MRSGGGQSCWQKVETAAAEGVGVVWRTAWGRGG